jgi:peptidoglycan hydrolase CwlO-like protein
MDIYNDYHELQADYKAIKEALYVIAKDHSSLNSYADQLRKTIDEKDKEIHQLKKDSK